MSRQCHKVNIVGAGKLQDLLCRQTCLHLDGRFDFLALESIADAGEFGLVRLITEDPEKATRLLEDAEFNLAKSKKNTEVTATFISEENTLSKITKILGDGGINIEYAYSSAVHVDGEVALILRPSDVVKAEQMLTANGVAVLSLSEIKKYFQ
jgi:hypothetical protein